jgi:hypothetical protein
MSGTLGGARVDDANVMLLCVSTKVDNGEESGVPTAAAANSLKMPIKSPIYVNMQKEEEERDVLRKMEHRETPFNLLTPVDKKEERDRR